VGTFSKEKETATVQNNMDCTTILQLTVNQLFSSKGA
jgi:hypothetical protein